jgi:hypothetical protein
MLKKRQAEIEAGTLNPDSPYFDDRHIPEDPETKDAKDAWKQLIAVARVKFPEHLAAKYQLRPKQRLVAIARTLGWEVKKIAKASDIHERRHLTFNRARQTIRSCWTEKSFRLSKP